MYQRWYYAGSTQFSDYAVGVLICISENDLYVLTLCMCTAIKLTFNLNIVIHYNRCTVDQWLMLVGSIVQTRFILLC